MSLDPDPVAMRRLAHRAADLVVDHLVGIRDRRVVTPPDAAVLGPLLAEGLPRAGTGLDATLDRFFDAVLSHATLVNHPRFFAFVPGPGSFAGAIGAFASAAANLFVGTWLGGAAAAQMEVQVLDWLREALGLRREFGTGILTSGGSMANLGALAAARARATEEGAGSGFRVFLGEEAHYSIRKAARVLGISEDAIVPIPADGAQRIDLAQLTRALERARADGCRRGIVCATAGTTTTGAIDPLDAIADLCAAEDLWLHVDGAYGAATALLPERTELRRALGRADSLTLDPPKWLYAPFEAGCLLTPHERWLRRAFTGDGSYMQDIPRDAVNFFERGPELTRGGRAVPLWFLFRSVGIDAIADAIRGDERRAQRAERQLAADPRVRIVTPTRLSVFTFTRADGDEARTRAWLDTLLARGTTMLSSSRVDGAYVLRFCVVNHATDDDDIDRAVAEVLDACEAAPLAPDHDAG
ncbi:MAG: pyridoxal phosphate-dependent decarboxylase family protein [Planctomycetota bacterium]